ncbi:MAG: hypothetical protein K2J78_02260, partial [Muribaculaceae bacterium]|nr:hypothetical protein [Muribaculaceae bacterium]
MKLKSYLLIVVGLILGVPSLDARIFVEKNSDLDSEMFQLRDSQIEDTVPYVQAYKEMMHKLEVELRRLQELEKVAHFYQMPISSASRKSLPLSGNSGTLSKLIGSGSVVKEAAESDARVAPPARGA